MQRKGVSFIWKLKIQMVRAGLDQHSDNAQIRAGEWEKRLQRIINRLWVSRVCIWAGCVQRQRLVKSQLLTASFGDLMLPPPVCIDISAALHGQVEAPTPLISQTALKSMTIAARWTFPFIPNVQQWCGWETEVQKGKDTYVQTRTQICHSSHLVSLVYRFCYVCFCYVMVFFLILVIQPSPIMHLKAFIINVPCLLFSGMSLASHQNYVNPWCPVLE